MNDNEAILAELRKVSSWADMQRRMTKWSLVSVAAFIPLILLFSLLMERKVKRNLEDIRAPADTLTWYDVDRQIREADFTRAIETGESLIKKTPLYPDGHRRLAAAYLAAGQIGKAKQHYNEAFRLFPSKENESSLEAIDRRVKEQDSNPVPAGDGGSGAR
jgi:tetratricopeptide (TPR) repeat protein